MPDTRTPIALLIAAALPLAASGCFGGGDDAPPPPVAKAIAEGGSVNPYLWAAALDTLSFMPLAQTDSRGGVIVFDWRTDPRAPRERFKSTVYILDRDLRADTLRVAVFKQVFDDRMGWVDAAVSAGAEAQIENAILTRARQLRLAASESE